MPFKGFFSGRPIVSPLALFKDVCAPIVQWPFQLIVRAKNKKSGFKPVNVNEVCRENRRKAKEIAALSVYNYDKSGSSQAKKDDLAGEAHICTRRVGPFVYRKPDDSPKTCESVPRKQNSGCAANKPVVPPRKPDWRLVKVYRYNGLLELNAKPRIQTYEVDVKKFESPMVLDLLIELKKMDPSLAFRRSCREGICGSCSINLQGSNVLACLSVIPKAKTIVIYPIPHMYVIRDLVVDMDHFIAAYNAVRPYLIRYDVPKMGKLQLAMSERDRKKLDGLYECILCACCSTSCPSYWWNGRRFLGPAALLHNYRWVIDSRDSYTDERLKALRDDFKVYRCHTIMNCTIACPKNLNPALAIAMLKRLVSGLDKKRVPDIHPSEYAGKSEKWIKGTAKYE